MSVRARARRGLVGTFAVFVVLTVAGGVPAAILADALRARLRGLPTGDLALFERGGGVLVDAVLGLGHEHTLAISAGVAIVASLLLRPWLGLLWSATIDGASFRSASGNAARRIPSAIAIEAATSLATIAALGIAIGGAIGAEHALAGMPSDAIRDGLAIAIAVTIAGAVLPVAGLARDATRFAVVRGTPLGAAFRAGLGAVSFRGAATWTLVEVALASTLAVRIAALSLVRGTGETASALAFFVEGIVAFGCLYARSLWLAHVAGMVRLGSESPAPRADGSSPPTR